MAWYNTKGKENDVVVSSRIRFARNIADYPFDSRIDDTSCNEIIEKVTIALGDSFKQTNFKDISDIDAMALVEQHYISPNFANKKTPHALLVNDDDDVSVMICEEDHIRLQCIKSGLDLEDAYKNACIYDDKLDENLNIAFDGKWGYLTHCPTNLGTGMRASVMLFLPALTMMHKVEGLSIQLSKIGLTVRGMYGEGSQPDGCLYQISNRETMGVTEEDTIKKLSEVTKQIIEKERNAREVLKSDNYSAIADRVCRSFGIMKYARVMSSKEFLKLYSDVRLGISLGVIDSLDYVTLGDIMIGVLPANLIKRNGGNAMGDYDRDILRAEYIRNKIG